MKEAKLTPVCNILDTKMETAIILSWVDDNIVMEPDNVVNEERIKIGTLIDIDDAGPLNEFVGCKVEIN